jgi:hypothetical protein
MGGFRIEISYSEGELAAYESIVGRKRQQKQYLGGWAPIATGFLAALAGGLLSVAAGVVPQGRVGFVAMLIFAGFWIGAWGPSLWAWPGRRRSRRAWLEQTRGASLRLMSGGLVMRRSGRVGIYNRSAVLAAGVERGLLLLWVGEDSAIGVPTRLLTPEQRAALLAFAESGSDSR